MGTVSYELKSSPGTSVEVPAEYAERAEGLVKLLAGTPPEWKEAVSEHPYLENLAIRQRYGELATTEPGDPRYSKLQDEIYLRVCIFGHEKSVGESGDFKALELSQKLIETVESLKSR